jgi:nicotinate dehydrogenase subunit A
MVRKISFTLNGKPASVTTDDERMLLWVLRYDLDLTGAKFGCGEGFCGACTVLVDKKPVRSCSTAVKEVAGKHVMTVEGLGEEGKLAPIQEAFVKHTAYQCGYCTSGMIMTATALLEEKPHPTRKEAVEYMDSNLCRCGTHTRILDAIEDASKSMKGGA